MIQTRPRAVALLFMVFSQCVCGGGGGEGGSSVGKRADLGEEVPGSIPTVAVHSLLVGLVSV